MRWILLCLLICLAAPLAAEEIRRATNASDCPIGTDDEPDWWTPQESFAWRKICAGELADMRFATNADGTRGENDGAGCRAFTADPDDPTELLEPDDWPETRTLSPRFLRQIAARAPFTEAPAVPMVRIRCAQVTGHLSLRDETIPQTLWMNASRLDRGLDLENARFGGDLSLNDSLLPPRVTAHVVQVSGDWFLQRVHAARIGAIGARIGGAVSATGSTFTGLFNADGMEVGGGVSLHDMPSVAEVNLLGAKIGGSVGADGSTLTGLFTADGMEVGGGLFLRDMPSVAAVELSSVRVGSMLQLQGSGFHDVVDLSGVEVADEVLMWRDGVGMDWQEGASLILRNASVGALQAEMPGSWQEAAGRWIPYDLAGFSYGRLGGFTSRPGNDMAEVGPARPYVDWLNAEGLSEEGDRELYGPQPYRQLARVLREMGAVAQADRVDFARLMHRRATHFGAVNTAWDYMVGAFRWGVDTVALVFVGFGVYPGVALAWFLALVGAGVVVGKRSPDLGDMSFWERTWFSLENALPLIELSHRHAAYTHRSFDPNGAPTSVDAPRVANFFHFQKVAGFALATVLVGALTLLGG